MARKLAAGLGPVPLFDLGMNLEIQALYDKLTNHFGPRSDPDTWWPIYANRTEPPEFERVITNVLVQNSSWRSVPAAVAALGRTESADRQHPGERSSRTNRGMY